MNATEIKTTAADLKDDQVRGLLLRVFPSGRKSFYLYYRTKGGEQRKPKIGDWPTVNLTVARDIAKDMLQKVAAGEDPSKQNRDHRAAATMKDLAETYMREHGKAKKTGAEDQRMIDRYILPELGAATKVVDVEDTDIARLKRKFKSRPIQANRILALLSKLFNFAEGAEQKYRPKHSNPVYGIARYPERKRERYATRDEATAVVERLRFYQSQYPEQVAFLWLSIYTGARPSELARAKRSDLQGDAILLREHKTDGTGAIRRIQLSPQAIEHLEQLPKRKDGSLLGIKNPRHLWRKILEDTKIEDLHIYDLRHTFASLGLSSGLTLGEIGPLMGHRSPATTSRYAHLIDEHAVVAVGKVSDTFDEFAKPKLKVVK